MRFVPLELSGAYLVELDLIQDERGFFARSWCQDEFRNHQLNPVVVQCNTSYTGKRGTLRGMHFQIQPHPEAKLVRCTRGAVYDVIIDLRPASATYLRWEALELTAANHRMLYIPEGFAHGFQTLEDDCEMFYQMSDYYHPECARGIRYDDPAFGIQWPLPVSCIAAKDRQFPDFDREASARDFQLPAETSR